MPDVLLAESGGIGILLEDGGALMLETQSGDPLIPLVARTRTLTVTPGINIQREAVTLTSMVNYDAPGAYCAFNRAQRPAYKFRLLLEPLRKFQSDSFSAFHFVHQCNVPFYWDAGEWGYVSSFNLIGEGNGVRKEFALPNRNIDPNSFALITDEGGVRSAVVAYSLQPVQGIVTLTTAPTSAMDVLAAHAHKYKLRFEPDGLKVELIGPGVYRAALLLTETYL